jgi:hypothetical protein
LLCYEIWEGIKGFDFENPNWKKGELTAEIKGVKAEINNRSVRKFNYLTSKEVHSRCKGNVALTS